MSASFSLSFAIIIGSLILLLGARVLGQNRRSFTNAVFFLHALVIAAWSMVNHFSLVAGPEDALLWIRMVLVLAVPHVFLSLIFIKNFPDQKLTFPKRTFFLLVGLMFTTMYLAASSYVFKRVEVTDSGVSPVPGILIPGFGAVLIIFVVSTFYTIVKRYLAADAVTRKQWAVMSSGYFVSYFLLISLVFIGTVVFGNTTFVAYSPLFVLPIFLSSGYSILRYRLFDIKVFATELLTAAIWLFMLVQALLPQTAGERAQDIGLLLVMIVLGSFLVKSVSAEVRQREQLQQLTGQLRQSNSDLLVRNRYLGALQALTNEITRSLNLNKFNQEIVDGISNKLDFISGVLYLLDKDGKTLKASSITNSNIMSKALNFLPKPLFEYVTDYNNDNTLLVLAMRTGRVQIGSDLQHFVSPPIPRGSAGIVQSALRARTVIAVPIFSEAKAIGCLLVASRTPKEKLIEAEVQMIKALADEVGIMARNLALYEQLGAANNQLTVANAELSRLDKAKTEFLSIASHQLRTPLTAIKGYMSMILEGDYGKVPQKMKSPLDDVYESAQRLIALVNDLLDVSRIASGRLELHMQMVDIGKMTDSVIEELKPKAEGKNVELLVHNKLGGSALIKADEEKLRQVVINLIDNSIKYTEKGHVKVAMEKAGSNLRYIVSDTGIGIAPDELPQLFHRFARTKEAQLVQTEGTGLGLYVAKTIIDAMGGKIWAESEGLGKGSKFIFELPFASADFHEETVKVTPKQDYMIN